MMVSSSLFTEIVFKVLGASEDHLLYMKWCSAPSSLTHLSPFLHHESFEIQMIYHSDSQALGIVKFLYIINMFCKKGTTHTNPCVPCEVVTLFSVNCLSSSQPVYSHPNAGKDFHPGLILPKKKKKGNTERHCHCLSCP